MVIDPQISYARTKENDSREIGDWLRDRLDAVIAEGASVILVQHDTKADMTGKTRSRGSGAFEGWADQVVKLETVNRPKGELWVKRVHEKSRELEPQPPKELVWRFRDEDIALEVRELDASANARDPVLEKRIKERLMLRGPQTQDEIAAGLGRKATVIDHIRLLLDEGVLERAEKVPGHRTARIQIAIPKERSSDGTTSSS